MTLKDHLNKFVHRLKEKETVRNVMERFKEQMLLGLNPETRARSSVKCFNTHIQRSQGCQPGEYLSMHLGATELSFMRISVKSPGDVTPRSVINKVPEKVKRGSGESLFDYMAEKLREFIWSHFSFRTEHVPLVFSFSFPIEQSSIDRAKIQAWSKGYRCEKVVGKNVNTLLREAALKHGLSLDIKGIINDVGGTFLVGRTRTNLCAGSIILGSGTNASYLEEVKNVVDFKGDFSSPYVVINTEWAGFGENGELNELATEYDFRLDGESDQPGAHVFEKMTAGLYLGEIVRLILVKLTGEKVILDGALTEKLQTKGSFQTFYMTTFAERDWKRAADVVQQGLGLENVRREDLSKIGEVCEAVSWRSARLVAACLAVLADRMGLPVVAFGAEGGLIKRHPAYRDLAHLVLHFTSPKIHKIYIVPTYGAGLQGAALLASALS